MTHKFNGLVVFLMSCCVCSGCTQIQDAVIRNMHMDYGYRGQVLPRFFDSYQQKMERNEPALLEPVPDFLDQG